MKSNKVLSEMKSRKSNNHLVFSASICKLTPHFRSQKPRIGVWVMLYPTKMKCWRRPILIDPQKTQHLNIMRKERQRATNLVLHSNTSRDSIAICKIIQDLVNQRKLLAPKARFTQLEEKVLQTAVKFVQVLVQMIFWWTRERISTTCLIQFKVKLLGA